MNRHETKTRTHLFVILFTIGIAILLERLVYLHYDSLCDNPVILNSRMAIAPVYNTDGSWLHGRWDIGYRFDLLCLERVVTFLAGLFLFRFLQVYNGLFSMSEKWLYAVDIELAVPVYRSIAWLYSPYTLDYLYVRGYSTFDFPDLCIGVGIFFLTLWLFPSMLHYYRFRKRCTAGMRFWGKCKWELRFSAAVIRAVFAKRDRWESLLASWKEQNYVN